MAGLRPLKAAILVRPQVRQPSRAAHETRQNNAFLEK